MICRLLPLLVTLSPIAWTCTIVFSLVPVGPNFQVKVDGQGRPVQGMQIELTGQGRKFAKTDKNGIARFRHIAPGDYSVRANSFAASESAVRVSVGGPSGVIVPLRWPAIGLLTSSALQGVIRGPGFFPSRSQPILSIDLVESISGRVLKSFQTTESGEFNVQGVAPGLYFLNLKPSGLTAWSEEEINGPIAIAIDATASADHVAVDLAWTSCGLWYANSAICPGDDLRGARLAGQVQDETEAAIAGASIMLFDRDKKLIEQSRSDNAGNFAFQRSAPGTYQIIVTEPGFTPLIRIVHLSPTNNAALPSPLNVKLGLIGRCSIASAQ